MSVTTIPRWRPPAAKHRAKEPIFRQVIGALTAWLAFGTQNDPDATVPIRMPATPTTVLPAVTDHLRADDTPPPPVRSDSQTGAGGWLRGWRNNDVAAGRLYMIREWCKTVILVALTATFLYVCWALVEWLPQ